MLRTQTPTPAQTSKTRLEVLVRLCRRGVPSRRETPWRHTAAISNISLRWLDRRNVPDLYQITDLANYVTLALRQETRAGQHRPAHRFAEGLFPLFPPVGGCRLADKSGRVVGQPETVWERHLPKVLSIEQIDRLLSFPVRTDVLLAARSGSVVVVVCDRLPGVGDFAAQDARHASRRVLLRMPRQGRQGTGHAVGGAGGRGGFPRI